MRFVGGEYEATEAAQGRLRRVLQLAGEKEGVTLEAAFGALDKVRLAFCFIKEHESKNPRVHRCRFASSHYGAPKSTRVRGVTFLHCRCSIAFRTNRTSFPPRHSLT